MGDKLREAQSVYLSWVNTLALYKLRYKVNNVTSELKWSNITQLNQRKPQFLSVAWRPQAFEHVRARRAGKFCGIRIHRQETLYFH